MVDEKRLSIATVDDDELVRHTLRRVLQREQFQVTEFDGGRALAKTGAADFDLVCLDLGLGDIPGIDVLKHIRAQTPEVPVVVVTGESDIDTIVAVMRAGAADFVPKPVDPARLVISVRHAVERSQLERRVTTLRRELEGVRGKRALIGESPAMRALGAAIERVLQSDVAVCVLGESGTGKEVVAREIHEDGHRKKGPFVAINCAAIPEHLQESELFGHEKGAFTGASATYRGRFEEAEGGTLFLDELGDMSPATQVKLLRALQEKAIRRVGGTSDIKTNVRVIGATHRHLEEMVRRGAFREDLYFRLMVYPIETPPSASGRPTCRSSLRFSWRAIVTLGVATSRSGRPKRSTRSPPTTGPATCASSKTSSSAQCSRARRIASSSPTFRSRSAIQFCRVSRRSCRRP